MRYILILATILFCFSQANTQVIFFEDFESGIVPQDWSQLTQASDGGWQVGTVQDLSSQFFNIEANESINVAMTNDDGCNCDKSNEYLISPALDLSNVPAAAVSVDVFYTDGNFQGNQEDATIEISTDKVNWTVLEDLHGHGYWDTHKNDISQYAGNEEVYIGIRYDDAGGFLYGMAVDNVQVEVPLMLSAYLVDFEVMAFGLTEEPYEVGGILFNNGINPITSITASYQIANGDMVTETFSNLDVPAFTFYTFKFSESYTPLTEENVELNLELISVNAETSFDSQKRSLNRSIDFFGNLIPPNIILDIVNSAPSIREVANSSNGLDKPTDLDFFPLLSKDELWVINERAENIGGSTVTITGATQETPVALERKVDGNSWHFMSLPTGIAFSSDNFNFANSPGVQDANHSGGSFTGPALWSSDPEIYAQPSGGNGSHLDMLHGSPYSMGIAHEVDNVFWIYDDWNKDIVRYDFVEDHGPGNADHSDGIVSRYSNIGIQRDGDIPNHMILDKSTGWLYFVDNGNDRVMRLDINSGEIGQNLPLINEPLAGHYGMTDFTVETIIDQGLIQPCGLELFENYLMVGDYSTGDITVYDLSQSFEMVGTISSGDPGLTGIKIGPKGNIWATNRINNTLIEISEGLPTSTENLSLEEGIRVSPNPNDGSFKVDFPNAPCNEIFRLTVTNTLGQVVYSEAQFQACQVIHLNTLPKGQYMVNVYKNDSSYTSKVIIK